MSVSQSRRDYMRDYMRTLRASGKGRRSNRLIDAPFVGVDGEGDNVGDSDYHAYFLLRAGQSRLVPSEGNQRLTTQQSLDFLCELPRDPCYVVYFGDYDVTKILEDLPWGRLERLINRSLRKRDDGGLFPVDWHEFELDYLPRKEFKVRRKGEEWLVINDVGSFFQCSFVDAISKWQIGTEEEVAQIRRGKAARGNFEVLTPQEVDQYNALEIDLLAQLMEKFRDACTTTGVIPARWQGPGQLAEALFKKHGVSRTKEVKLLNDVEYSGLLDFAQNSFYGGRPEIMAVGPIDRAVYQYDINSAYPYAMLRVPCLNHGRWRHARHKVPTQCDVDPERVSIAYGFFTPQPCNVGRMPLWYGLPVRTDKGTITYPGAGRGWYWVHEIQSAIHQKFMVEEEWVYERGCDCQPLSFVRDVYAERQRLGKDDAGTVLKLALNSLYGKSVQSIGMPKYANPIWGSFITSYCRKMIQDFIHSSPQCTDSRRWCGTDILMVATDSVCTWTERTDIPLSKDLGGWSVESHPDGMFIVQPGLYFGTSGKASKTRGVPRTLIEEKEREFRDKFEIMCQGHNLSLGDVDVPQRLFCGIRYTLHRHNTKLLGQWVEFKDPDTGRTGKTIRFDWTSKRARYPVLNPMPGVRSYIQTFPLDGSTDIETVPYSKDIGGLQAREEARMVYAEQPDWIQVV